MSSIATGRRRGLPALAALVLLLPVAHARAEEAARETTVQDALHQQLPGRQVVESLRRSLTPPSAATRWRGLTPFGRDLFARSEERFTTAENGPVGPDYVLGPGDNLMLFVSGLRDTSYALTLDREGKVFLPLVGSTFLWGQSFASADQLIRARLGTVLRNARVQVSMGRLRALDVFVLGSAARPGKYTLTGLATAFNALSAAGGPDPLGSLRDIRVLRGNREVARLDLYRFLLDGDRANDVPLQSGDVVFVGLARMQAGIQGAVIRPGVYEGSDSLSLRQLLVMAGGPSPFADLTRIRLERVDANGGFRLQDLPLNHGQGIDPDSLQLSHYDLITVMPLNERVRNVVTLDGFVRHPGEYELTPGLTLRRLLAPDRLLPEASMTEAELRRLDPVTFQIEVRPVDVRRVWSGEQDLPLQPLDAVTVFSSARMPRTVTLEGEVVRPGVYSIQPGDRLSDVLQRAGGVTAAGHLPAAAFYRRSVGQQAGAVRQEFLERQRVELAQQHVRLAQAGDTAAARQTLEASTALTAAVARRNDEDRVVLDLAGDRWRNSVRDPVLEDGDRLVVPLTPATVTVVGSVMNPGTVMARRNASFADYLELAGGVTSDADLKRAYVIRANGAAEPRSAAGRVAPGDAVVIPPRAVSGNETGRTFMSVTRFLAEIATAAALVVAVAR